MWARSVRWDDRVEARNRLFLIALHLPKYGLPKENQHGCAAALGGPQLQPPQLEAHLRLPFGDFCCKTALDGGTVAAEEVGDLGVGGPEPGQFHHLRSLNLFV